MKRKKMEQRLMGIAMLIVCTAMVVLAAGSPADKDIGAVVILLPLSLYLIFTRKIVIY